VKEGKRENKIFQKQKETFKRKFPGRRKVDKTGPKDSKKNPGQVVGWVRLQKKVAFGRDVVIPRN